MKAMLKPRIVATRIQGPLAVAPLAIMPTIHSLLARRCWHRGLVLPDPVSGVHNRNWKSQFKPACKSAFEGPHVLHTPTLQFEGGLYACDFVGARTVKDELAQLERFGQ